MTMPGRRHSALPRSRQGVDGGEQVARGRPSPCSSLGSVLAADKAPGDNDGQPLPGLQVRSFVPQLRHGSGRGAHRLSANTHSAGRICGAPGRDPRRPPEQQQGPACPAGRPQRRLCRWGCRTQPAASAPALCDRAAGILGVGGDLPGG